jgi:hypothetical protein
VDVLGASTTPSLARVAFAETAARVEDARVSRARRVAARDGAGVERGATAGGMFRVTGGAKRARPSVVLRRASLLCEANHQRKPEKYASHILICDSSL